MRARFWGGWARRWRRFSVLQGRGIWVGFGFGRGVGIVEVVVEGGAVGVGDEVEAEGGVVVNVAKGERVVVVVVVVGGRVGVDEAGTVGTGVVVVAVVIVVVAVVAGAGAGAGAKKGGLAGIAAAATGTEAVAEKGLAVGQDGAVVAVVDEAVVTETVVALDREVAAVETDEKDAEREVGGDSENTGDDNGLRSASQSRSKEK
jgi:hypothetical protein